MIKLSTQKSGHDKSCVRLGEARPCHRTVRARWNSRGRKWEFAARFAESELRTRMNTVMYSLRTVQIDPEMGTVNKSKETYCKSTSRMPRFHRLGRPGTRLSTRSDGSSFPFADSLHAYHQSPWDFLLRPAPLGRCTSTQKRCPSFLVPPTTSPLPVNP